MPRNRTQPKGLEPDFNEQFKLLVKSVEGKQKLLDVMFMFCDCMNDMVTEKDAYLTWGMSKNGTVMNVVMHIGSMTWYATGASLEALLDGILAF